MNGRTESFNSNGLGAFLAKLHFHETRYGVLFFYFHSEYVKVIDGNGVIVLSRYGYSSTLQKPFLEVRFGNSGQITVQINFTYSYSRCKLQFGILKQGLQSG